MFTVLIVEDDPINMRVFSKILKKRGNLQVEGTENGEEVVKMAISGEIDVILMDVSLSNTFYQGNPINGLKLTQVLKSNPDTANIPVIIITAHAMQGDREKFLKDSGADDYISKPIVDQDQFVQKVIDLASKN